MKTFSDIIDAAVPKLEKVAGRYEVFVQDRGLSVRIGLTECVVLHHETQQSLRSSGAMFFEDVPLDANDAEINRCVTVIGASVKLNPL